MRPEIAQFFHKVDSFGESSLAVLALPLLPLLYERWSLGKVTDPTLFVTVSIYTLTLGALTKWRTTRVGFFIVGAITTLFLGDVENNSIAKDMHAMQSSLAWYILWICAGIHLVEISFRFWLSDEE